MREKIPCRIPCMPFGRKGGVNSHQSEVTGLTQEKMIGHEPETTTEGGLAVAQEKHILSLLPNLSGLRRQASLAGMGLFAVSAQVKKGKIRWR